MKVHFTKLRSALLTLSLISQFGIFAQERNCSSMEVLERQLSENPQMEIARQRIEQSTAQFIASGQQAASRSTITVPVVFHIIWRTGTPAENISDAQVMTQLDALNKDFSLLNADASKIPVAFKSLAANVGIKFALAKRTPWGALTNGVNHYESSRLTTWGATDDVKNTAKGGIQAWDTKKYLNVWVCAVGSNILGYAQFPGGGSATDGIVLDYQCVGVNGTARVPFNLGRTLTHEVGHWLNLYHIWGNGACGDDMVGDTPSASAASYGCPTFPQVNSCGVTTNAKMTMNFMDYTNDQCMYMFTKGQVSRIQSLFAIGGPRASLVSSDALIEGSTTATCGVPVVSAVKDLYATSAYASWTTPQGASSFNVRYKTALATTWTTITTANLFYNITGLTQNTEYEYQVQAVCYGIAGAYSTAQRFKTPLASNCPAPQNVRTTSIVFNAAQLAWSVVPGATQYRFKFKRSTSTTWNEYTLSGTACKLSIAANTTYQAQVAVVCGTTISTFSPILTFTTPVAPPPCTDVYETVANNTMTTASALAPNIISKATISSATDVDWFSFRNTALQPHIQIALNRLTVNYGLKLYNEAGTLLNVSDKIGKNSELLVYNNAPVGKYYIQVYGNLSANDTYNCYDLIPTIGAVAFVSGAKEGDAPEESNEVILTENSDDRILSWQMGVEAPQEDKDAKIEVINTDLSFKAFPNPVSNNLILNINAPEDETRVDVTIFDYTGREVYAMQHYVQASDNKVMINMSEQQTGLYMVRVKANNVQNTQKIIVRR